MKTVWIINHYAQERGGVGGTRHFYLAKHLQSYGWEAVVIGASVEHKTGRQRLEGDATASEEVSEGVRFLWLRTSSYSGSGADRITNMLQFTRQLLRKRNVLNLPVPDVIVGSSVHPFAAWAGMRLARRHSVPFVFEVRDLWPQTLISMGRISQNSLIAIGLRVLEKRLYRQAARIVTVLPRASDYISRYGIPEGRIVWIPNGVDSGDHPAPQPPSPSGTFTLMYFGAHGPANALDTLLKAMVLPSVSDLSPPVELRLIGSGPAKPSLIALAEELRLKHVHFEDPVPRKDIPRLAADADAFVITVRDLPDLYRYGISMNKIFDYMAAARPIILASSATNDPIKDAGCGISVGADSPGTLAVAIHDLAVMPVAERTRLGTRAREYVMENHEFNRLAARLAETLDLAVDSRTIRRKKRK